MNMNQPLNIPMHNEGLGAPPTFNFDENFNFVNNPVGADSPWLTINDTDLIDLEQVDPIDGEVETEANKNVEDESAVDTDSE